MGGETEVRKKGRGEEEEERQPGRQQRGKGNTEQFEEERRVVLRVADQKTHTTLTSRSFYSQTDFIHFADMCTPCCVSQVRRQQSAVTYCCLCCCYSTVIMKRHANVDG